MSPRLGRNAPIAVAIEDDDSLRDMIMELLELAGFSSVGCPSGEQGIVAIRALRPALVTLDLHMPGMDGIQVLEELARSEATATVPVVVVSAYTADRRLHLGRQVKAVLQKPFDVDELCRVVREAAGIPGLASAPDTAPPVSPKPKRSRETRLSFLDRYAV